MLSGLQLQFLSIFISIVVGPFDFFRIPNAEKMF